LRRRAATSSEYLAGLRARGMVIARMLDPTVTDLSAIVQRYKSSPKKRVEVLLLVEKVYTQHFNEMRMSVSACRTLRTAFNLAFVRGGECEAAGGPLSNPFNDPVVTDIFGELAKQAHDEGVPVVIKMVIQPDQMDSMFEAAIAYASAQMARNQWAAAEWAVFGWVDAVWQRYFGSRGATVKGAMRTDVEIQSCVALDLHQIDLEFMARRLKMNEKARGAGKKPSAVEEKAWPLLPAHDDIFRCARVAWAASTFLGGAEAEAAVAACVAAGAAIDKEEDDQDEEDVDEEELLLKRYDDGAVWCPIVPSFDAAFNVDYTKVRTRSFAPLWDHVQDIVFGDGWVKVTIGERYFRKFFASDAQRAGLDMYSGAQWCVWGGDLSVQLRYNTSYGNFKRLLAGRRLMRMADQPDEAPLPGRTPWALPTGFKAQLPERNADRRAYAAMTILTLALGQEPPPMSSSKKTRLKWLLDAFAHRKLVHASRPPMLPSALVAGGAAYAGAAAAAAAAFPAAIAPAAAAATALVGGGAHVALADLLGASLRLPRTATAAFVLVGAGASAALSVGGAMFGVLVPPAAAYALGPCMTAAAQVFAARQRAFTPPSHTRTPPLPPPLAHTFGARRAGPPAAGGRRCRVRGLLPAEPRGVPRRAPRRARRGRGRHLRLQQQLRGQLRGGGVRCGGAARCGRGARCGEGGARRARCG
jgi:hypothetical protein